MVSAGFNEGGAGLPLSGGSVISERRCEVDNMPVDDIQTLDDDQASGHICTACSFPMARQ